MGVSYDFLCSTETDTTGARWFLNFEKIFFDEIIVLAVPWTNIPHSDEMSHDLRTLLTITNNFNNGTRLEVVLR